MKYWKAGLLFLIAYFIQCSLLNLIDIGGYTPNLMLALVIVFSFVYDDAPYGLVFGSVFGIVYDLCYGEVVGPMAIAFILVFLFIREIRYGLNIENIINLIVAVIPSIIIYYLSYWGLVTLTGTGISLMRMLPTLIFSGIYTFVFIVLIYAICISSLSGRRKHRKNKYRF